MYGFAVSGLASTPYNVAVGGTEFNDTASPATYWNASNGTGVASAKGYIPEVAWNESSYTTPGASGNGLWAGGGGVSTLYARPSWQTGTGVPAYDPGTTNQKHRLLPDVSLTAAGHDGYLIYQEGSLYLAGGTSATAPSMAGIVAIVNQKSNGRNGNVNTKFYPLATSLPSIYHDVTTGSNAVPCEGGTLDCSAAKPATNVGVLTGYNAGTGYDLATGLGSVDANALAANWGSSLPPVLSLTSLSPNPMTASSSAQTLTITGTAFQSGATVKVGTTSYAAMLVSSTKLTVSLTEAAAGTFAVTVTNPGGATSNSLNLTVTGASITSLSPNPMTLSASAQTLTINGTGFQSGAAVKVGTTSYTAKFVSSTQLTVSLTEAAAGTFAVTVTNPGSATSNSVNLTVTAPAVTATITTLSPNPMTASNSVQVLTVNGTGFQSGLTLKIGPLSVSSTQLSSLSATKLTVSIITGTTVATYPVQVVNPGAAASNTVNLVVAAGH
jgi:subtilase family serine protease